MTFLPSYNFHHPDSILCILIDVANVFIRTKWRDLTLLARAIL